MGSWYKAIVRSLSYPDTYFYVYPKFEFEARKNQCIIGDKTTCDNVEVLLQVHAPGVSSSVKLGESVEITWKFWISQPNEWEIHQSMSLFHYGRILSEETDIQSEMQLVEVLTEETQNTGRYTWGVDSTSDAHQKLFNMIDIGFKSMVFATNLNGNEHLDAKTKMCKRRTVDV